MATFRLQSAMEYLLTYGWAILIIAAVLVALFSLGVFNSNPITTSCIAKLNYVCGSPVLHANTFNALIGESTGRNWIAANILWVPSGTQVPAASDVCPPPGSNTISTGISCYNSQSLKDGFAVDTTFIFSSNAVAGNVYTGQVWAMYQVDGGSGWYEAEMAGATLKAV